MQCFTFEQVKKNENVFEYGDIGNTFYVIIKGTCSVLVRNPQIRDWYFEYQNYRKLLEWKENIFDPKVEQVKKNRMEDYNHDIQSRVRKFVSVNIEKAFLEKKFGAGGGSALKKRRTVKEYETHTDGLQDISIVEEPEQASTDHDIFQFDIEKHMDLTKLEAHNLALIESYQTYKWFVEVKIMKTGESFGELALKNNAPRAATIRCETKCYFAVIHRTDYDKFLKRKHHKTV